MNNWNPNMVLQKGCKSNWEILKPIHQEVSLYGREGLSDGKLYNFSQYVSYEAPMVHRFTIMSNISEFLH